MKIVIFPFAKAMRESDKEHPKNYPWWPEVIAKLKSQGHNVIQVGVKNEPQLTEDFRQNLSLSELATLINEADTWIGVDSFGQHFCWDIGKRGVVLFGQSDPNIFGHEENINLLKSRDYLRDQQFWLWEQAEFKPDAFVDPETVIQAVNANFR
jgi:ADP-heptose:LPS heptosyltransferase